MFRHASGIQLPQIILASWQQKSNAVCRPAAALNMLHLLQPREGEIHTSEKKLQLCLQKSRKNKHYKKNKKLVTWQREREQMGFNRQVEAGEQVEQTRTGEKHN